MQQSWQDFLPLGPLQNTAAAICTEVGFCWGQERTEHWLHHCPFRPRGNTHLKNVHRKLLWFLKGVVYQALHLLVLKSDSATGWLIPLPGVRAETEAQRRRLCFRPFYPFTWAVPREMPQCAQLTVSVSASSISLVCCYTHILKQMFSFLHWEVMFYLPSVLTYMLIIKMTAYKNQIKWIFIK